MSELDDLHQQIRFCNDCELYRNANNPVPGEGSSEADLMFIGEGPGYHEDRQGRPFVGPAGQFLNELLALIGLRREDVFIANMVKHRPPDNRDPLPAEIQACGKYLEAQIKLIKPKVIIPLGRHALSNWLPGDTISKAHGRPRRFGEFILFPQYHPAAALHNPNMRPVIERDFRVMGDLLRELDSSGDAPEENRDSGQQLSML